MSQLGYIYIGYRGRETKIGISVDLKRRWKQHRNDWAGNQMGFSFAFQVPTYRIAQRIEGRLKARFSPLKVMQSEWFRVTNEVMLDALYEEAAPHCELIELDPCDYIAVPHATEMPLMRDGDVWAYDQDRITLHRLTKRGPSE